MLIIYRFINHIQYTGNILRSTSKSWIHFFNRFSNMYCLIWVHADGPKSSVNTLTASAIFLSNFDFSDEYSKISPDILFHMNSLILLFSQDLYYKQHLFLLSVLLALRFFLSQSSSALVLTGPIPINYTCFDWFFKIKGNFDNSKTPVRGSISLIPFRTSTKSHQLF